MTILKTQEIARRFCVDTKGLPLYICKTNSRFMGNMKEKVWQMAAGRAGHFYSDIFFSYDVMCLGLGDYGEYQPKKYKDLSKSGCSGYKFFPNIARLYDKDKVLPEQIVLMREGRLVKGIGVMAKEGYGWNETFDDVHGWNLSHTSRVIWQHHLTSELNRIQTKGPLFVNQKRMQNFTMVHDKQVLDPLRPLFSQFKQRALKPLPAPPPPPLSLDEVGQQLFAKGISNDAVDKVIAAISRQRRLQEWYDNFDEESSDQPTEHEVVAHMVLPLLLALGWSEQLLAVEWKNVDLAAFSATPRTAKNCVLVCEAKFRYHGLQDVREQAFKYVRDKGLRNCCKVLLTDGGRFYLFKRDSSRTKWSDPAAGYVNLAMIRTNHIALPNTNAINTIVALTPAAYGRPFNNS